MSKLSDAAVRTGNALAAPVPSRRLIGSITEPFSQTHTYRVRTAYGEINDVVRLANDPGDSTMFPVDTFVVLHNDLGFWVIEGVLKQAPSWATEFNRCSITEVENIGGENPNNEQSPNAASFRGAGDPKTILPNDWIRHSGDGNFIGVLSGGMNTLFSSPFAQIRTHAINNSVEIKAHEYKHTSSMGDFTIKNDGGKTSLSWRAGTDQSTETGADAENWTFWLDAGAPGDIFRFRVSTPQGQTLAEIHITPEGRLKLYGANGVDITSGNDAYQEVVMSDRLAHTKGSFEQRIDGPEIRAINSTRTTSIAANEVLSVGGGASTNVTGSFTQTIGGSLTQAMGASSRIDVTNGYLDLVLGDPTKGGLPGGQLCFVNHGGDVHIKPAPLLGKFVAFGSTPGSIMLGADAIQTPRSDGSMTDTASAPYSAMLYEYFNSMMGALVNWLDTHTHPTAVGPSSVPLLPCTPMLQPMMPAIQSLRVKLGG